MSHNRRVSSWDNPKGDASNMRICFIPQLSLSIKGTISTFQYWECNDLISKHDGPSPGTQLPYYMAPIIVTYYAFNFIVHEDYVDIFQIQSHNFHNHLVGKNV